MKYDTILFDFDGTLVDSSGAIIPCVEMTYAELGRTMPDTELLKKFIGPPLIESFRIIGIEDLAERERAVDIYRRVFNNNDYMGQLKLYEGMGSLLMDLKQKGVLIAIASIRVEAMLLEICRQLGLDEIFEVICGRNEEAGILTKGAVVKRALGMLGNPGGKSVLIGDSKYDEEGAVDAGVDFIAAMYGFGFCSTADVEHAVLIAHSVDEIAAFLK